MQSHDQTNSIKEGLSKLNKLNDQMQGLLLVPQQLFRSYIGCYVEGHSICDDYFSALCEHAIINRLFGQSGKHVPIVSLLEIFHLLLANTNEQDKLVFLFSQSTLHQFLFQKIDIITENIQSIEYYVQLLKTIVLKLSNGNNSLIKLFCNNRYPSFPLLTAIVTLATYFQKEELVKVTAQQCLLELTGIINQKQIGRGYLSDLQMSVFFYQLGWTIRQKLSSDQEGQLKYLADLLFSLRNNQTSLSFLLSSFTNLVILPLLSDLPILLRVLRVLAEQLQQHGQFPLQVLKSFRKVILNIITTFYFAKFTNSTYMTTMKLLQSSKKIQPNLSKYYLKRGDKVGDFLLQFDSREPKQQEREKYVIFESWVHFNSSSEQVQKIKQGKHKQRASFLSSLFSKPDIQQEYIKTVLTSIGLNHEASRFPLFKLAATLNYKTGLFIVQQALTKREQRGEVINREQLDAHINQTKGQFQLSEESCKQILKMIKRLQTKGIIITQEYSSCPPEVQFQLGFLLKFRTYLLNTLSDYFLVAQLDPSLLMIAYWTRTLFKLGVPNLLDRKVKQKLVWKLQQVQQEINDLTFANDFRNLISYITNDKERIFLSIGGQNEEPLSPSPKNLIQVKTFKYQFLRKLIDPQHVSLSDYVNQQWCITLTEQQLKQLCTVIVVNPNLTIQIKISQLGICLNIIEQQLQLSIKIEQNDPRIDCSNNCKVFFRNHNKSLLVRDKQQAFEIRNNIERIRSFRQQKMTKLIVQYFQITYNKIRDKILQRIK